MLIKYQLRKKEIRKKEDLTKIIIVYLLIYRAGGPTIADFGTEYLSCIPMSGFVYICMSIQLCLQ